MDSRGFPGCIGSWGCQHCGWNNCPLSWSGQFKGKEKKPTIVLESITDPELYIWSCNFRGPKCMIDINIFDWFFSVQNIVEGKMLPEFNMN